MIVFVDESGSFKVGMESRTEDVRSVLRCREKPVPVRCLKKTFFPF